VTPTPPPLLLDACTVINLSYCSPIAALFKTRYVGTAGWTRAVQSELTRQRSLRPPHPQAGNAVNWAVTWLEPPIDIVDEADMRAIEGIQREIALGSDDDSLLHLGEAASIHLLEVAGTGRLISDDHGARSTARAGHGVRASSTVGVLSMLMARGGVAPATVDLYLNTLRTHRRMNAALTSADLLRGNLAAWA
jgi:hypothetical protein